jgi:hypothetical protein
MDRVETRGRVPLETLLDRLAWCNAAAAACAACAGLLAGLTACAALRGCAPAACGAAATRAALERNIREGVYARDDWDAPCGEEVREVRSRFSYTQSARHGIPVPVR